MSLWKKNKREQELEEEIKGHLQMAAQDRMDRGESPGQAESAAHRELGNAGLIKEVTREMWGWAWLERLLQDLRYGVRMLRKNPGTTFVSVLTLALGISASTTIFSVVYGVLLRPLPYPKPDQIVRVSETDRKGHQMQFCDPNFSDFREQSHSLQGLAEFNFVMDSVSGGSEPKRVIVASVSRDFFSVLGVQPILGRTFAPEEQNVGASPVALVSYDYWKQSLNGVNDLSRSKLRLGSQSASVVGVLPPGFRFPNDTDIWSPRELFASLPSRSAHNWKVVGRLRDGISLEQARTELSSIGRRLKQQYGDEINMEGAAVSPLRDAMTGQVRSELLILLGAVGFLLLVGCANVMNLLLAQASAREGELGIRTALGASRGRLVRQFLAEALLLSLTGGGLGVLSAYWGIRGLVAMAPRNLPRLQDVSINLPVLLFALALSVLVATALGIFTALRATSGDARTALAEGNKGQAGGLHSPRLGRMIIATQLAITLVLLVGAGLLGRSLLRVLSIDPGFRTEQVVTMDLALPPAFQAEQKIRRAEFIAELLTRLRVLPGVQDVGGTNALPLGTGISANGTYAVMNPQQITPRVQDLIHQSARGNVQRDEALAKELTSFFGQLFRDPTHTGDADYATVDEGYFRTLGIPLQRGRLFDDRDAADAPHVALISESLARQKWPNQDPLGQSLEFGNMDGDMRLLTVVGVVGDVRESSLETPARPTIYVNLRQRPQATRTLSMVLRTSADTTAVLSAAQKIVRELDPDVAPKFNTFSQVFSASLNTRRFNLTLVGAFALTALLLAMAGIYGVLAYSVARRTREIGVRIALGASVGNVLKLILGQSMLTVIAGVVIGIAGSFLLTRTMQSLLFGVSATDPVTLIAVALLLTTVALLASYVPARSATRVDPIVALRYE